MTKRPTRDDVARVAGVSVATVSYVVNNGPRRVSHRARTRVVRAIDELGYRPHAIARSLRTGNTRTVGLLIPTLISPGLAHLTNAVEDCLASHNYALVLASSHEDIEREGRILDVFAGQSIDGLLFTPTGSQVSGPLRRLMEQGMPVVFLDRCIPGVPADAVMTDNVRAGRQATELLIGQGCRRILCVCFSRVASSDLDRVEGYRQALREHNLAVDEDMILVIPDPSGEDVNLVLETYLEASPWPEGILCTSQMQTVSVVKSLRQRAIRIPDQVAVVGGFFVSPWDILIEPPLPLVSQDLEGMASQAVELMMQRLRGDDQPPRTVLLDTELVLPKVPAVVRADQF
jgi:LacI family transcriptional regulator